MDLSQSSEEEVEVKDGPILIAVTRSPQDLSKTPMLLAVTPLPRPDTTPPVTKMYFIVSSPEQELMCQS